MRCDERETSSEPFTQSVTSYHLGQRFSGMGEAHTTNRCQPRFDFCHLDLSVQSASFLPACFLLCPTPSSVLFPVPPPLLYFPTSRGQLVGCGRLGSWLRQGVAVGQGKSGQDRSFRWSHWVTTQTTTLAGYSFGYSRRVSTQTRTLASDLRRNVEGRSQSSGG